MVKEGGDEEEEEEEVVVVGLVGLVEAVGGR